MMRRFFVDSWCFIALTDRNDRHHPAARRLDETLPAAGLITTDAVLMELLAFYSDDLQSRRVAARTARRVLFEYTVVPSDRSLFIRALDLYERRFHKEYSLVDCMSMVVMEDLDIHHVLSNDHHFEQAGFTLQIGRAHV